MVHSFDEQDIKVLSKLHHEFYYKTLHSNYEDQFPKIKGVSSLEMGVLSTLSETPVAMLKEIAEKLAVSKSTLTSVVDRLEQRGYVYRVISSKDRRSFELALTEDGKLAQQQHLESERGMYLKILNALDSKTDVELFISMLSKIVRNF